jgi:MscS family membrane protein
MSNWKEWLTSVLGVSPWVATLIGVAVLTVVINAALQWGLRQFGRVTRRTTSVWDDALVYGAQRPLAWAVWVVGAGFMARVLQRQTDEAFLAQTLAAHDVALVACVAWGLLRFFNQLGHDVPAQRAARGEEIDHTTLDALLKLARLTTVVAAALVIAPTLGFQIGGLLALGGVGGLAVGLAAKDILANFFGGLTIYLDRPFAVGDWIRSPDKSIEGTVEYVSWRHTRIRAFNKNPIYVPNAVFTSIVVENPSRMSHRRLKETVGLRYGDFAVVQPIVDEIRAMIQAHPGIDTSQTLIVNFSQFGASSLDILIYTFTRTTVWTEFHHIKQDVLLKVGNIIARHGAEIAFPTQTLHLQSPAPNLSIPPGGEQDTPERTSSVHSHTIPTKDARG